MPSPTPRRPIPRNRPKGSAARLPFFVDNWAKVCSNNFILRIVAEGYKLQFISNPIQTSFNPRDMSASSLAICYDKSREFLDTGAIISVSPESCEYISHIFPVPKKTLGEFRIIFDLTSLNKYIRKVRFRMDSIASIMPLISPGDWLISIDLSDAYHTVPMHFLSMPFLSFILFQIYYQFTCLPQGLSSSPRVFTMLMRVVMKFLRSLSVKIAAWIDDFLLAARSAALVSSHASLTLHTFEELGFIPNIEKSHLTPVQRLCHLGLVWDTVSYTVSVPLDKLADVQRKCRVALSSRVSIRFLASILGSIEFFRWGFPHAAVHYRALQRCVTSFLSRGLSYGTVVPVPCSAKVDLDWWASSGSSLPARSLYSFSPDIDVYTDSSLTGWGGWTSRGERTFGYWSVSESKVHINVLELKAVIFMFQCFFRQTADCSVLVRSDNTSVVAYINHQGGSCSARLCDLALELWHFCIVRNIVVKAVYLPGSLNTEADALSRMSTTDHSYTLSQSVFDSISDVLHFHLSVDCFASRLTYKLPVFYSWQFDPLSTMVNAFSSVWMDGCYLFPPLPLVNKVISKFISDSVGCGLLIAPNWPSATWFSSLLTLLIDFPFLLPTDCVLDEAALLPKHCRFLAWPIGCDPVLQLAFQRKLPLLSSAASIGNPFAHINVVGDGSACGVLNEKLVTVRLP